MGEFKLSDATNLIDSYGRAHRDLRVSLTDRCSLRCTYCMPSDYSSWIPSKDLLTADELLKIIEISISLGITEVRLTGGEPLLRPDIIEIVERINLLENTPELSMTTNGIALARVAKQLALAGLKRINISLDTLNWATFKKITFRDRFDDVIEGIYAARSAGIKPIKINTVLLKEINEDEAIPLLKWAIKENLELRFIEQMPLDAGNQWNRFEFVKSESIINQLTTQFELTPVPGRGSSPAELFLVNGGPNTVGIIGSISNPFCSNCDRIRLTSDGQLRSCLFARSETDLRGILRDKNLSVEEKNIKLVQSMQINIRAKMPHHGINDLNFVKPNRPMSAIGG